MCIDTGERTRAREYLVAILQEPDHPTEFIFLVISPACMRMCAAHTSQRAPSGQFSRGKVNVCGTPAAEARNISFWKIVRFVSGVLTTSEDGQGRSVASLGRNEIGQVSFRDVRVWVNQFKRSR